MKEQFFQRLSTTIWPWCWYPLTVIFCKVIMGGTAESADFSSDFSHKNIAYLKDLKQCKESRHVIPSPFKPDTHSTYIIYGFKEKVCQVEKDFSQEFGFKAYCAYSPDTIQLLTSEAQIQILKERQYDLDTNEHIAVKEAEECNVETVSLTAPPVTPSTPTPPSSVPLSQTPTPKA